MIFGYRITKKDDVGLYSADLVQISFYNGWGMGIEGLEEITSLCKEKKIRYVIHPVNFFLSETRLKEREETMEVLRRAARLTDMALILHDERVPGGGRLFGIWEKTYRDGLNEIEKICNVSIENANNSHDAEWFWRNFALSITIDIGHLEAAGINSSKAIKDLPSDLLDRIEYVHLHRNNGLRAGLTDHWPITRRCRELNALEGLLKRKSDIRVILEINETEEMGENLRILGELSSNKS
jgi:sugar phosphate isomerase/epimerase